MTESDTNLRERILAELARASDDRFADVGIAVCEGIVSLHGSVKTVSEKHAVKAVISRFPEICGLWDELAIAVSFEQKHRVRTDERRAE